jgi:hypothetical protein
MERGSPGAEAERWRVLVSRESKVIAPALVGALAVLAYDAVALVARGASRSHPWAIAIVVVALTVAGALALLRSRSAPARGVFFQGLAVSCLLALIPVIFVWLLAFVFDLIPPGVALLGIEAISLVWLGIVLARFWSGVSVAVRVTSVVAALLLAAFIALLLSGKPPTLVSLGANPLAFSAMSIPAGALVFGGVSAWLLDWFLVARASRTAG